MVTGVMGITAFPAGVGQVWDSPWHQAPVEKPVESPDSRRRKRVKDLNPGRRQVIHRIHPFRTKG